MLKKILITTLYSALFISAEAQGFFSTTAYNSSSTLGASPVGIIGWGENFDRTIDVRPNPNSTYGTMIINYHTGLTLSAHSFYGGIRFYNQGYPNAYDAATGSTMVMSITNGNVGIGTTAPMNPLTIGNGNPTVVNAALEVINTGDVNKSALIVSNWTGSSKTLYGPKVTFDNSGRGVWYIGGADGTNSFDMARTWGNPDFRIDADGNVAIGTLNASGYKLAINGSALATSVTVKSNANWPDYVFDKSYYLPSLQDVESYINQNQHLPEVPSKQEIDREGQNLGELNKLLLKKVEELTLYLIEKDKQLGEQNARINVLSEGFIQLKSEVRANKKN